MTEIIPFYFPQFHRNDYNDEWWGYGFTDWDLVRTNKPLFNGHNQPRVPSELGYYNPCDSAILKKQVEMAKKYSISGFNFYHYWFDGTLMLNEPIEVFLKDKTIDFKYCLTWANPSWTRQWIGKNDLLIEQRYIRNTDYWEKHFLYLLKFFKDDRYLKLDGKPIFMIYAPDQIPYTKEMFGYWNNLAVNNGLSGIYYIAIKNYDFKNTVFLNHYQGLLKFQPRESNNSNRNKNKQRIVSNRYIRLLPEKIQLILFNIRLYFKKYSLISSESVWNFILKNMYMDTSKNNIEIFESAFFDWDNSPRYRGKASIYTQLTTNQMYYYFYGLYKKSCEMGKKYIFFNAWNEWSESAYLEPDIQNGYTKLEIISRVVSKMKNK